MGKKKYFFYFMSSCTNKILVLNYLFALIYSQRRGKQKRDRDFLVFKYFLNNLFLTFFIYFQNSLIHCNEKCMTHYWKKRGQVFVQHPMRKVGSKFKVDRLSCFRTGTRQVFTTQKPFPAKFL